MLIEVLVKDQLEGGAAVLEALAAEDFPVSGAFWVRGPEVSYWQLILASPLVSRFGPLAAYRKVSEILGRRNDAVSPSDISLFSPVDPEYVRLREYALGPGQFGIGPVKPYSVFQDAYIYT